MKHIAEKRNSRWLKWEGQVLIDEIDKGRLKGRNQFYKSIVIKNPIKNIITNTNTENNYMKRFTPTHGDLQFTNIKNDNTKFFLGKTIKVRITGYTIHSLEGIQII